MKDFIKKQYEAHKDLIHQMFKFGIVGFMNTLISWLMLNGLYLYFEQSRVIGSDVTVMSQTANFITFVVTVFIGFWFNRNFVFKPDPSIPWWKSMFKMYLSYSVTGIFMNAILYYIQVTMLGVPVYIASFINLCFTVPTNFILSKLWTFK